VAVAAAHAEEHRLLGGEILVRDGGTPASRRVIVSAKELESDDTIVGDPTVAGAWLTIALDGATPTEQSFPLPSTTTGTRRPFWRAIRDGFVYRDTANVNGAVRELRLKLTRAGTFFLKASAMDPSDPSGIVLRPPDPGTDACVQLAISGGDSYSIRFGPESRILNRGAALFVARRPLAQDPCGDITPSGAPTRR